MKTLVYFASGGYLHLQNLRLMKKLLLLLCLTLFILPINSFAQWAKNFDLIPAYQSNRGKGIFETNNGGLVVLGLLEDEDVSTNAENKDIWFLKLDASGDTLITKIIGDSNQYEYGKVFIQTSDGGYIICGYTHSYGNGMTDLYLIKTGLPLQPNSILLD